MSNPSLPKKLCRILTWGSLIGLMLVLALVLQKSPPPDVANDPVAATRVEQKFAAADQLRSAGQQADVSVTLDRTELNSYLQQNLQTSGSPQTATPPPVRPVASGSPNPGDTKTDPLAALNTSDAATLERVQSSVKDVKVDMDGDLVKAYLVFDFHGKDLSLELDGHLGAKDGYLRFEPVAGRIGSMPLPQSMLDAAVEKMMDSPENRARLKLPDDISNIQIQNGQAVVSYK